MLESSAESPLLLPGEPAATIGAMADFACSRCASSLRCLALCTPAQISNVMPTTNAPKTATARLPEFTASLIFPATTRPTLELAWDKSTAAAGLMLC